MLWVLAISTDLLNDIGCKEKKQALLWGSSLSPHCSSIAAFALPAPFLPLFFFFLSLAMQACQVLPLGFVIGFSPSLILLVCTLLDHMSYDHMPYVFTLLDHINMSHVWHSH